MSSYDLNKVMLIGNVGRTPEEREFGSGKRLVKFSLATNESWKNKQTGEYEKETQWHNCVCFNEFLCKLLIDRVGVGTKLYVEGTLKTRSYRQEGDTKDRYMTEIVLPMFGGDIKILSKDDVVMEDKEDPFKDDIPF